MENCVIRNRLQMLREQMSNFEIDFYMIPTSDFHNSEYVNDYFKVREYFSNFTGSNGSLLVWKDGAGLWTDGRYFIQAEKELEGTGITLFRMLDEGVPTMIEFLSTKMKDGETLGFDGRVISAKEGKQLEKELEALQIKISFHKDLAEEIWQQRPMFPAGPITVISDDITGKTVEEKLNQLREQLIREGANSTVLTKLDDIMWLFNIRGCDVEYNPVAMSYAYITLEDVTLFVQKKILSHENEQYFKTHHIEVKEYHEVESYLIQGIETEGYHELENRVLIDERYCSYSLYRVLMDHYFLIFKKNPTELLKAVKNDVELVNMRKIYLYDSIAVTKFIYWLKKNIGKLEITEVTAADYLEELRRVIPGFLDLSFPTIAGYKENAAMMHYEAVPEHCATLKPEGMLLVDSGAQYLGGTTDVTRTIVLGPISDEMKKHYTLVTAGMLQLSHAKWIYGCTGRNLDILARQPLWNIGIDYKCGTGHGVGYILNVHEGPQNLRWRFTDGMVEAVIEEGMDLTNEPGVYLEGSHGIRIENVMVAQKDEKNEYGQFMHFETLTWVPIDREAIDERYLTEEQKQLLQEYQKIVYEKNSPYLNEEEREWLQHETGIF